MIEFIIGLLVGIAIGFGLGWLYVGLKIKKMIGNIGKMTELFNESFTLGEKDEDLNNTETEVSE